MQMHSWKGQKNKKEKEIIINGILEVTHVS